MKSFRSHHRASLHGGGSNGREPRPECEPTRTEERPKVDPPTNLVPMKIPVVAGQSIVLALQFLNGHSGSPFEPSVVWDADGCQASLNAAETIPGGWADACLLGVTGDWVIRAVVDCPPPLPLADDWSRLGLVMVLLAVGMLILHNRGRNWSGTRASARSEDPEPCASPEWRRCFRRTRRSGARGAGTIPRASSSPRPA